MAGKKFLRKNCLKFLIPGNLSSHNEGVYGIKLLIRNFTHSQFVVGGENCEYTIDQLVVDSFVRSIGFPSLNYYDLTRGFLRRASTPGKQSIA